ncbi:hypothetical protein [Rhodococcus sp. 06-1460-1B]|nr:hypothetical protein [Rhodococcus sp. 06-1460-1B]
MEASMALFVVLSTTHAEEKLSAQFLGRIKVILGGLRRRRGDQER